MIEGALPLEQQRGPTSLEWILPLERKPRAGMLDLGRPLSGHSSPRDWLRKCFKTSAACTSVKSRKSPHGQVKGLNGHSFIRPGKNHFSVWRVLPEAVLKSMILALLSTGSLCRAAPTIAKRSASIRTSLKRSTTVAAPTRPRVISIEPQQFFLKRNASFQMTAQYNKTAG